MNSLIELDILKIFMYGVNTCIRYLLVLSEREVAFSDFIPYKRVLCIFVNGTLQEGRKI